MKLYLLLHHRGQAALLSIKRRRKRRSISGLLVYEKHQLENLGILRADVLSAFSSRLEKDPSTPICCALGCEGNLQHEGRVTREAARYAAVPQPTQSPARAGHYPRKARHRE